MVTLEQVKLLESKVVRAVDYIRQATEENTLLKNKLSGYEKKIADLESLIQNFKEDQGRIEKGIISALERLDQFEDAIDSALTNPGNAGQKSRVQKTVPDKTEKSSVNKPFNGGEAIMPNLEAEKATDRKWDNAADNEESEKSGELDIF